MKGFNTAIILAGGKSTRMGFDKQLLRIGDTLLIELLIKRLRNLFPEIIIVTNKRNVYKGYNLTVVEDEIKDTGPLGGLHGGLKYSSSRYSYVIACDMPYLNCDYIRFMMKILKDNPDTYALVTKLGEWIEPFNSFYSKKMLKEIERHVRDGEKSIHTLLRKLKVTYIEEEVARKFSSDWKMFDNINTKEELERYCRENKLAMEILTKTTIR